MSPARTPEVIDSRNPEVIARAAAVVRGGGVIAIPTDTVYGFAASIESPPAIARLYALKGRPSEKAIPVLLYDISRVERVTPELPSLGALLADRFWPGALTLVVPALPGLPERLTSDESGLRRTVAIRVPDHAIAREIIAASGGALAVTSANRSGAAPALTADEILSLGKDTPDLIVDDGPATGGVPSTIVLIADTSVRVLREGAIPEREILATIGRDHFSTHPTRTRRVGAV